MVLKKRRLGRGVAIVGCGLTKFGSHHGVNCRDLFAQAFSDMTESVDKGFDPAEIEALWVGNAGIELFEGQTCMGPYCADLAGMLPRPVTKVENACAGSGVAIREAVMAIASGMHDVVVAGGTEKMTGYPTDLTTQIIASSADVVHECGPGFTFPGLYGALATAYMHKYGISTDDLLKVAIKNHSNGALNPKAHFPQSIRNVMDVRIAKAKDKGQPLPTWVDELEFLHDRRFNPIVAWPLTLFDACPVTDGAGCVLLVAEEIARNFTDTPIYIIGSGQGSDGNIYYRDSLTELLAQKVAAKAAYEMAGVSPGDIKMAEVHDCFTIAEILALSDLGFFEPGEEAAKAAGEGKTTRDGIKPINTDGGLKAKGHPVGATGAGQVVEIFHQMRGEAGERQVKHMDIDLALTANVGAHGMAAVVHIFERR